MTWRVARSLEQFRNQVNAFAPKRNKASDGTIGDTAHQASTSDHNAWVKDGKTGVVTALDITHDVKSGVDTYLMAEQLRQNRDPRIKYVISNKRIFSSTTNPWTWRTYTGSNPHSSHIHISVNSGKAHYDSVSDWNVLGIPVGSVRPILRNGSRGLPVAELQGLLSIEADGSFGNMTEQAVKAFQQSKNLTPDGVVGPMTWDALDPVKPGAPDPDSPDVRSILRLGSKGNDVRTVQRLLAMELVDGDFGPLTDGAVKDFQQSEKLNVDGVVGPRTWAALDEIEQLPTSGGGVRILEAPMTSKEA